LLLPTLTAATKGSKVRRARAVTPLGDSIRAGIFAATDWTRAALMQRHKLNLKKQIM
jgi:hypothetical protein